MLSDKCKSRQNSQRSHRRTSWNVRAAINQEKICGMIPFVVILLGFSSVPNVKIFITQDSLTRYAQLISNLN